jgi:nitrogenase molybdenum-iron protein alpha chain
VYRRTIFCAGIKEKYSVQKMGIPCKQLHSYDYGGPYAGFGGDQLLPQIDRMVNSKVWSFVEAPWQADSKPALEAAFVSG